jgi:hypothetical protein
MIQQSSLNQPTLKEFYKIENTSLALLLSFLIIYFKINADKFSYCLRLPNKLRDSIGKINEFYTFMISSEKIPLIIKPEYKPHLKDALILCGLLKPEKNVLWQGYLKQIENVSFIFPLSGKDLIHAGYNSGQTIGFLLEAGKSFWYTHHFNSTKEEILDFLLKEYPPFP